MSRKNDDSIEEFFRKAVRQSDTTFREDDWAKMEKMLDEQTAAGGARSGALTKRIVGGSAAILVLLVAVYFYTTNDKAIEKRPLTTQQAAAGKGALDKEKRSPAASLLLSDEKENNDAKVGEESDAAPATAQSDNDVIADNTGDKDIATTPGAVSANTSTSRETKAISKKPASTGTSRATDPPTDSKALNAEASVAKSIHNKERDLAGAVVAANKEQITIKRSVQEVNKNESPEITEPTQESSAQHGSLPDKSVPGNVSHSDIKETVLPSDLQQKENLAGDREGTKENLAIANTPSETPTVAAQDSVVTPAPNAEVLGPVGEDKKEENETEKNLFSSRWSAALVVAPDFSSTSFGKMTSPGGAYGLMIGYRFFNRITLTSGVLKTSKKYEGYGSDYHPPYGYWEYKTNGVVPDKVYGQCSVIEIPVQIQYDIKQSTKSRIYLAGGLSSYRMLSESYRYSFEEPNPGADDSWSSNKPSSYAFSIGHLSAGYERRLFNGLSLGLEPYVKIPFKGIGWSSVNLFTTGLYVNARYRF